MTTEPRSDQLAPLPRVIPDFPYFNTPGRYRNQVHDSSLLQQAGPQVDDKNRQSALGSWQAPLS